MWEAIERRIADAEAMGATIGVSIRTSGEERFGHNADRRFRAASTVKIPIMVRLLRMAEMGEVALDDRVAMTPEMSCGGTGVLQHLHSGIVVTVADLLYLMMSISDNTATNALIDITGVDEVTRLMRAEGMAISNLGRKMQGFASTGTQPEHWAVPAEYAALMQAILEERVASATSCARMVGLLEQQHNGNRIGRHLPAGRIRWGSKVGTLEGVVNDVGFVRSHGAWVVVSAFCEGLPDEHAGEALIGAIAREAVKIAGIATPAVRA